MPKKKISDRFDQSSSDYEVPFLFTHQQDEPAAPNSLVAKIRSLPDSPKSLIVGIVAALVAIMFISAIWSDVSDEPSVAPQQASVEAVAPEFSSDELAYLNYLDGFREIPEGAETDLVLAGWGVCVNVSRGYNLEQIILNILESEDNLDAGAVVRMATAADKFLC